MGLKTRILYDSHFSEPILILKCQLSIFYSVVFSWCVNKTLLNTICNALPIQKIPNTFCGLLLLKWNIHIFQLMSILFRNSDNKCCFGALNVITVASVQAPHELIMSSALVLLQYKINMNEWTSEGILKYTVQLTETYCLTFNCSMSVLPRKDKTACKVT